MGAALSLLSDASAVAGKHSRSIAALDYLKSSSTETWPFAPFRFVPESGDPEARWRNLNASLNGSKRFVSGRPVMPNDFKIPTRKENREILKTTDAGRAEIYPGSNFGRVCNPQTLEL
jgi:hypothetical protein